MPRTKKRLNHRVFTYEEKKINRMSRQELFEYLFHGKIDPRSVRRIVLEKTKLSKMSMTQAKAIAEDLDDRFLKELRADKRLIDFVITIFDLQREFNRDSSIEFSIFDGLALICYLNKMLELDTKKKYDEILLDGLLLWVEGGSSWDILSSHYYNTLGEPFE